VSSVFLNVICIRSEHAIQAISTRQLGLLQLSGTSALQLAFLLLLLPLLPLLLLLRRCCSG
jgi:hypothetical protein